MDWAKHFEKLSQKPIEAPKKSEVSIGSFPDHEFATPVIGVEQTSTGSTTNAPNNSLLWFSLTLTTGVFAYLEYLNRKEHRELREAIATVAEGQSTPIFLRPAIRRPTIPPSEEGTQTMRIPILRNKDLFLNR